MPLVASLLTTGLLLAGFPPPSGAAEAAAEFACDGLVQASRKTPAHLGVSWGSTRALRPPSIHSTLGSNYGPSLSKTHSRVGKGGRVKESRWRRRLYVSAGLTVTAAAIARWSKQKADRSYDRYLTAANQNTQKSQFDRAERYDRISGVALAAMEAGVILTTYFVFF